MTNSYTARHRGVSTSGKRTFTQGLNGYVCPNEGLVAESRAVFKGTYRDCQIWVERRGISAALRYVMEYLEEVPELSAGGLTAAECLERLWGLPSVRSGR